MEIMTGQIVDVIYHNDSNGFTVAVLETDNAVITVTGNLPYINPGIVFELQGKYKTHPKYGEQFAFFSFKEIIPKGKTSVEKFLASGAIKGIGPKTAGLLIESFDDKVLEIIENNYIELTKIKGIGPKTAEKIHDSYVLRKEFADVAFELEKLGITTAYALKIYKEYGGQAVSVVKENPYQLIEDIYGISFQKADEIAGNLGIDRESEFRIKSGILFTLNKYINSGNTYLPKTELIEQAGEIMDVSMEIIEDRLINMAFEGSIKVDNLSGMDVVYISNYYFAERSVCSNLIRLKSAGITRINAEISNLLNSVCVSNNINLSDEQITAVEKSLNNNISIITGGPGTGKTTIINTIIGISDCCSFKSAIAAPTGRAAKRITETSGYEASTIHKLLEYQYVDDLGEGKFLKNAEDKLAFDLIIVDEASMIDLKLMDALLQAIPTGTRLILVGDVNQLPSVGAGNVLRDLISSEYITTIRLNEIFRQAKESLIVVNAHLINKGEYPYFNEKDQDFFMLKLNNEQEILNKLMELVTGRIEKYYDFVDSFSDIQIITPSRKGNLGVLNLNKKLQEVLNPQNKGLDEKTYGDKIFRVGDKVMQIRNDYSVKWRKKGSLVSGDGIFNGDMGVIDRIDIENDVIGVIFDDDKYVEYDSTQLDLLELAYAITVHKSQGSEFPVVIMPISWFPPMLATRNLLYTAITRGKNLVILLGSEKRMQAMVDNNRIDSRCSGLGIRLRDIDLLGFEYEY